MLSIRIRGRYIFNVSLTSNEKLVSNKMLCVSMKLELISVVANPKGGNRTLRVRIRGRCIFNVFLTSNEKLVLIKCRVFQ